MTIFIGLHNIKVHSVKDTTPSTTSLWGVVNSECFVMIMGYDEDDYDINVFFWSD